jgi:hypothetical protein
MRLMHSPMRFYKAMANFNDSKPHLDAIESIGFGGLLQIPSIVLRKNMV